MAQEPLLVDLREPVAQGERLRMELLTDLRQAAGDARNAVRVELTMFYGRAFVLVMDALSRPLEPRSRAMTVLHTAVQGRAIFSVWLDTETPAAGTEDLGRLETYWGDIARLVLGEYQ